MTDDEIINEIKADIKRTHNIMPYKANVLIRIALTKLRASLKVAEMPTEVTDDEIAAMALEFAPVCIYGDDDDCEDVNGSIREDVTKLLKQLRNRMSKPNNCTGGEG
jgi:hypothetical protein